MLTRCLIAAMVAVVWIWVGLESASSGLATTKPASRYPVTEVRLAREHPNAVRIVFVGNSLTAVNDLPSIVRSFLARGSSTSARRVFTVSWVPPGATLGDDLDQSDFVRLLSAVRWDAVVLQEGTPVTTAPEGGADSMDANVHAIIDYLELSGAMPLLFETWGNRPGTDSLSFSTEQRRIRATYATVGRREHIDVAPVGDAWAAALKARPSVNLWASAGHHPSAEGSLLAGAVLATCLQYVRSGERTTTDPTNVPVTAGANASIARWLRHIAWTTVANHRCATAPAHTATNPY